MAIWTNMSTSKKRQALELRQNRQLNEQNEPNAPVAPRINIDDDEILVLIDTLIKDPRSKGLCLWLGWLASFVFLLLIFIGYLLDTFSYGKDIFNPSSMLFATVVFAYYSFGIWYFQER